MTPQEAKFRQQYAAIICEFENEFPGIQPPDPSWITIWLRQYNFRAICDAIQTLQNHPPHVKARFSQESVGRAISALLRADAVKRAIASVPTPSGVK